ncbi:MAG: hypothetical protein EBY92_08445, partial [Actinobacteria bacterium]|nr:hypothetical protein [Actinomycetota bacterium]
LGIPALKMSDGPNGVRGESLGANRTPGVNIPTSIVIGASWDRSLAQELGELLGREARRKSVHVVLAPTVNLHRTPIGGRTFECLSEDPELSAQLAAAIVRGVQSNVVAVTVKHFAGNDTEVERMTVDAQIDDTTLREFYLRPFEATVLDAGAWGVMSSYNKLNGAHAANNVELLRHILRDDWGFDGFVVSDWFGAHDTAGSIEAGLDVPMPGPATIYGRHLLAAVREGRVSEVRVNERVETLLRLIERTRADEFPASSVEQTVDDPNERSARRQSDHALADHVRAIGLETFLMEWTSQPMFASLHRSRHDDEVRLANSAHGLASSLELAGTGEQDSLWDRLHELHMPVLVVTGANDEKFSAIGDRLIDAIGDNARHVSFPTTGHAVPFERPGDFAALLTAFLR